LKLFEISNIVVGHPFRGKIPEEKGSGVCAVQMKDVSILTGINWSTCIETEITGKRESDWLMPGDVLFVARGSHNYAVLVDETAEESKAVAAPHFYILRCRAQTVLPQYLVWFLNQGPSQRYFQREAEGSLTKSIRRTVLEHVTIAVPSLERQQSIIRLAEVLKKEQQLIDQLKRNGEIMMNAIATDLLEGSE
jgi:restriction endonuclease S subunit